MRVCLSELCHQPGQVFADMPASAQKQRHHCDLGAMQVCHLAACLQQGRCHELQKGQRDGALLSVLTSQPVADLLEGDCPSRIAGPVCEKHDAMTGG